MAAPGKGARRQAARLADLFRDLPHRVVYVERRRPFREPGAPRDEVLLVRAGMLAKYRTDVGGRRRIVSLRFPGEGILPHTRTADYGLQAIVRSEILIAKAQDFEAFVNANPEVARFLWQLVQRHNAISYEWLVNTGRRDSAGRVAHLLCETATRMGIDARIQNMVNPFTQQQIADITGQTAVNVTRVFAELQQLGLIHRRGQEIQFKDWVGLCELGCFEPTYLR